MRRFASQIKERLNPASRWPDRWMATAMAPLVPRHNSSRGWGLAALEVRHG
jgi:hypothetical protein